MAKEELLRSAAYSIYAQCGLNLMSAGANGGYGTHPVIPSINLILPTHDVVLCHHVEQTISTGKYDER